MCELANDELLQQLDFLEASRYSWQVVSSVLLLALIVILRLLVFCGRRRVPALLKTDEEIYNVVLTEASVPAPRPVTAQRSKLFKGHGVNMGAR